MGVFCSKSNSSGRQPYDYNHNHSHSNNAARRGHNRFAKFGDDYHTLEQIGWIYGSVTEDILTGFKMYARGWRSIYCMPKLPTFKGSAPINLSDRLNQVLRWALGSVEILFSRHCPIWYGYEGRLKFLERFASINTTIYPLTSIPLLIYCVLPAICLLTGKFIIPEISNFASIWFISLFISIFATGILEMRWSGVGIDEWWRNEQFWVIGGISAHLFAVFQGLLKVLAGIDTNFTVTSKASDEEAGLDMGLAHAGLESSNLIVGIDFTKSNEWTGKASFNNRSLHAMGDTPNPYE